MLEIKMDKIINGCLITKFSNQPTIYNGNIIVITALAYK